MRQTSQNFLDKDNNDDDDDNAIVCDNDDDDVAESRTAAMSYILS